MHALKDRQLQARCTDNMQLLPDAQCPFLHSLHLTVRAYLGRLLLRAETAVVLFAVVGVCIPVLLLQ